MVSQALVARKDLRRRGTNTGRGAALRRATDRPGRRGRARVLRAVRPGRLGSRLGGDWYSVLALPDRRTYLAVGDVVGHGLVSVEDMAQNAQRRQRLYAHLGLSPARILAALNRFAAHQIGGEFATNLVAIYDPADRVVLQFGGHLPALLRRADTGEVVRLSDTSGPMLGPFDDATFADHVVPVAPGTF